MPEILWLNHAGYELRVGGLRIIHDPWLFGRAFADGWALVSESKFQPQDFAGVDFIWFSHEHPDHFSPPVLKAIPEHIRREITVLFQTTRDKRVVSFCKKLGFKTRELPNCERIQLSPEVAVTCGKVGGDSWLHTEAEGLSIFNANDCFGCDWREISGHIGKEVDLLLTQFSYANWTGNPGENSRMSKAAECKIIEMQDQISAFNPKQVIPFASYVWFCRHDNFYLNQHANRIASIFEKFSGQVDMVVAYPGDSLTIGEKHDSTLAIASYERDWASKATPIDIPDKIIELNQIKDMSLEQQARLFSLNTLAFLKPLSWIKYIVPVNIHLEDLRVTIRYCMFGGILNDDIEFDQRDITFSSESFLSLLRNGYGCATLMINGRYRENTSGATQLLSRNFAIPARNEEGFFVPRILFQWGYVKDQVGNILKSYFKR